MRFTITGLVVLLGAVPTVAFAQVPPCSPLSLGFDPYNPSDLAIVRQYGGTAVAQAPLGALLQLDPYVPIQGELQRQLGSAIPLPFWGYPWYPQPSHVPDCRPADEPAPAAQQTEYTPRPITEFAELLTALQQQGATTALVTRGAPTGAAMGAARDRTRERNTVSIQFAGRTWISDGPAVSVTADEFTRIGESAGFPIFRRAGTKDDVIYVPTTAGLVAPFRVTR